MPVPTRVQPEKNIWVAASDGDLDRVRELVENQSLGPNVPDENTYTPMHAAASYGHLHVLDYLVSKGGNVNVTDADGDTPLYVVENIETARYLIQHGAVTNRCNDEGLSPAAYLSEDFPEVATYLDSLDSSTSGDPPAAQPMAQFTPSQHAQNQASEQLTTSLLQSAQEIMQRADAEGRDPDEELRQVVGRAVLAGVATGYGMSTEGAGAREDEDTSDAKRPRTDGGAS